MLRLLFMGSLLVGCQPPPDPPSVLLVTMDTTRADHLAPYGYTRAPTPTLSALAQAGTLFQRAYSTAPLTIPSHSTIMTGRNPPSHGVRDNGDFNLGSQEVTLAERFAVAGYTTAAFTAAFPTQARWGFDQGFHIYHDPLDRPPALLDWRDRRPASEVVDDALGTLSGVQGPLFVWLHFFDPHWPYAPPQVYLEQVERGPNAEYDGEIAYMDAEIGRFLRWWDDARPESLVVVTADHGEGLGDGGERTHGFLLHDGTIHVPLIIRGPGMAPGARNTAPVSHVDIAPTVLALAGLEPHAAIEGRDLRQGGSPRAYSEALTGQFNLGLAPLLAYTEERGRYMEGGYGAWYQAHGASVDVAPQDGWNATDEPQVMAALVGAMEEGLAPASALDPGTLDQLMALGYIGGDPIAPPGTIDPRDVIDVIPLTWRARHAIGEGAMPQAEQMISALEARLPDTFGVDLLKALLSRRKGELELAVEQFTDLFLRSPSSTLALHLADIMAMGGAWAEAEGWYVEASALQPASPEAMAGQVRARLMLGDELGARELADTCLDLYPDHAELLLVRAEMALLDEKPDEALRDATRALREMSHSIWALTLMARIRWELGDADPSLDHLQEALRLDPYNIMVRGILTQCLLEVGRNAEAVRTIRPLVQLFPDDERLGALYQVASAALEAERHPGAAVPPVGMVGELSPMVWP